MSRLLFVVLTLLVVCVRLAPLRAGLGEEEPKASKGREAPPAPEPARPLSPSEQQQRLRDRNRLGAETQKLQADGKLAEAITAAEKLLAIERQLFGDRDDAVVESLQWLAELHEQREDFPAAGQRLREVQHIQTARYGQDNWRVRDARLALDDVQLRAKLDGAQRKRLAEAERLHGQILALHTKGKSREAIPLAERALALRKQVLGDKHPHYATRAAGFCILPDRDLRLGVPLARGIYSTDCRRVEARHPAAIVFHQPPLPLLRFPNRPSTRLARPSRPERSCADGGARKSPAGHVLPPGRLAAVPTRDGIASVPRGGMPKEGINCGNSAVGGLQHLDGVGGTAVAENPDSRPPFLIGERGRGGRLPGDPRLGTRRGAVCRPGFHRVDESRVFLLRGNLFASRRPRGRLTHTMRFAWCIAHSAGGMACESPCRWFHFLPSTAAHDQPIKHRQPPQSEIASCRPCL
jgi:Tetratricopeptide repeat